MSIKNKSSIAIAFIFILNILLLVGFYRVYIRPSIENEASEVRMNIKSLIEYTVSSKEEAEYLTNELSLRYANNDFRLTFVKEIITNLFIFEATVLFFLLIIVGSAAYFHYAKPTLALVKSIDAYGKGVMPKPLSGRKDEIGILGDKFIQMTEMIEAEKQKQNQIIASIAHDIKTPLTVIMGYSERLLSKKIPPEREKQYLSTVYGKAQNINEIVNEFDEYLSYNFEGSLQLKEITAECLCEQIVFEYTEELLDMGVNFTVLNRCKNDTKVCVDLLKFKRVIGNLVSNSIKAMRENPSIVLEVAECEKWVSFIFSDNGCGVPQNQLPFIFDPLYTSDSSRKVAGLGLSICKNIVAAHGGEISAECGKNNGLAVKIVLQKNNGERINNTF